MKKIIVLLLVIMIFCCGCSAKSKNKKLDKSCCTQPGAYFVDENRYTLVDEAYQELGDEVYLCKVFADKYMLTMYLLVENCHGYGYSGGMTQIFYEDGSPMIYDPTEEEYKEWESVQ